MTIMQALILALTGMGDNYTMSATHDGQPHIVTERGISVISTTHGWGVEMWRSDWDDAIRVYTVVDALRIIIADYPEYC